MVECKLAAARKRMDNLGTIRAIGSFGANPRASTKHRAVCAGRVSAKSIEPKFQPVEPPQTIITLISDEIRARRERFIQVAQVEPHGAAYKDARLQLVELGMSDRQLEYLLRRNEASAYLSVSCADRLLIDGVLPAGHDFAPGDVLFRSCPADRMAFRICVPRAVAKQIHHRAMAWIRPRKWAGRPFQAQVEFAEPCGEGLDLFFLSSVPISLPYGEPCDFHMEVESLIEDYPPPSLLIPATPLSPEPSPYQERLDARKRAGGTGLKAHRDLLESVRREEAAKAQQSQPPLARATPRRKMKLTGSLGCWTFDETEWVKLKVRTKPVAVHKVTPEYFVNAKVNHDPASLGLDPAAAQVAAKSLCQGSAPLFVVCTLPEQTYNTLSDGALGVAFTVKLGSTMRVQGWTLSHVSHEKDGVRFGLCVDSGSHRIEGTRVVHGLELSDSTKAREVLAVPSLSLLRARDAKPEDPVRIAGLHTDRRKIEVVRVTTGIISLEWIEVKSGLAKGEPVVYDLGSLDAGKYLHDKGVKQAAAATEMLRYRANLNSKGRKL